MRYASEPGRLLWYMKVNPHSSVMARIRSRDLYEADDLLAEVAAWSEEELAALPRFYREKADEYRRLAKTGEEEDTTTR